MEQEVKMFVEVTLSLDVNEDLEVAQAKVQAKIMSMYDVMKAKVLLLKEENEIYKNAK